MNVYLRLLNYLCQISFVSNQWSSHEVHCGTYSGLCIIKGVKYWKFRIPGDRDLHSVSIMLYIVKKTSRAQFLAPVYKYSTRNMCMLKNCCDNISDGSQEACLCALCFDSGCSNCADFRSDQCLQHSFSCTIIQRRIIITFV